MRTVPSLLRFVLSKAALKMHQVRIHRRKSSVVDVSEEDINEVTLTGKDAAVSVNMSNHKKCSKRLLKKPQVISRNDLAVDVPAEHVIEEEGNQNSNVKFAPNHHIRHKPMD